MGNMRLGESAGGTAMGIPKTKCGEPSITSSFLAASFGLLLAGDSAFAEPHDYTAIDPAGEETTKAFSSD
jgi:hypothetical protein